MKAGEIVTKFRERMRDTTGDYLWSDTEAYYYLDDAQKQFCRETGGIADATSALTTISVTTGDKWIPYDSRIMRIRTARRTVDNVSVPVINNADVQKNLDLFIMAPGKPDLLAIGMDDNNLRLFPEADDDYDIELTLFRLPLTDLNGENDELEIAPHHHIHLVYWMGYLAHLKKDAETFDEQKASDFRKLWADYIIRCQVEHGNRHHKNRSVRYGGY